MSTEREALRLQDIVENIDWIDSHLGDLDYATFVADRKTIDAVERCLLRIAEAVVKIGPERMAAISPATPVDTVRGMGNALRHAYDEIDLAVIWRTVRESLPALKGDCLRALA